MGMVVIMGTKDLHHNNYSSGLIYNVVSILALMCILLTRLFISCHGYNGGVT